MIRLASSITEDWDPRSMPFYLELYGEDEPLIDTTFAEALPAGTTAGKDSPTFTNAAPVYEYWWTLGFHRDPAPEKKFLRLMRARHGSRDDGGAENETRERFAEPAAHVGIFFPTQVNWRVKEVTATLKFLTPLRDQHRLWQDISGNIAKLSPLLTDAASVVGLVPGGTVASTALSTVARLQVASVPQTSVKWSVEKTAPHDRSGRLLEGVEWVLPQNTFDVLGGRVSGSVAVTSMQAQLGEETDPTPRGGRIMARAFVWCDDHAHRIPDKPDPDEGYLGLSIRPQYPPAGKAVDT